MQPFRVVPVADVEVDPELWDWCRRLGPGDAERPRHRAESIVFPVAERDGRLVLLSHFDAFVELRKDGATVVRVWVAEVEPGESLLEYALAFSLTSTS